MAPELEVPGRRYTKWAYPGDLARFVAERWQETPVDPSSLASPGQAGFIGGSGGLATPSPDAAALEELLSACYQASMLREEERPVTFRAVLAEPGQYSPGEGPPEGLQRLEFPESRPCEPQEIRRLSVAAEYHRSLIGVKRDAEGNGLRIWGLIHSGPRWLHSVQGGRKGAALLPAAPVVMIEGPGHLEVYKGQEFVGRLEGGVLSASRRDVFDARWLLTMFRQLLEEILRLHRQAITNAAEVPGERLAPLDRDLSRLMGRGMVKRVVSVVRDAHHGGTILWVPSELAAELSGENPYLNIKYPFAESESRWRYRDLAVSMLNRLSRLHATSDGSDPEPVGWAEFERAEDGEIEVLDEALFEQAHLISGLAACDGAVVLGMQNEILGFGAEISGQLPVVKTVARALDLEGENTAEESVEGVGTRHRSAYRLCGALPGSIAIVISQDGDARFVTRKDGRVTYWDQD